MFDISGLFRWFTKRFTWKDTLFMLLLLVAYLATRIVNLDQFPIFTDEGIYIRWSKVAWQDASWRFISLTDGKQPLHTWGMIPFLKVFSPNLLLGGRAFSVLTGLVALKGLFNLTYYLWGKKAAYTAAILYIFTPMFLFYDRMALADSAVNAGFIWILFGSILLVRTLRLDVALGLGLVSGFTLLTKSSSQMFLGLSALAPILMFQSKTKKGDKKFIWNALNYYVLFALVGFMALVMYNIQRLSPYLHYVAEKNTTFVLTFGEFIRSPFSQLFGNLPLIPWYVASEMSYVTAVLGLVGLILLVKKDWRLGLYLMAWLLLPYIAISLFAKVIFPRYLIFFATTLTLGATYLLWFVKDRKVSVVLWLGILASFSYFNYTILFDNDRIPFPPVDRGQYIESFNSGYGIKDMIAYSREASQEKPVILLAEGNFGVVGDMLESSIGPGEKISVRGYWPLNEEHLIENQKELAKNNVFVVYSHKKLEDISSGWPIELIEEYKKPGNQSSFYFYRLLP